MKGSIQFLTLTWCKQPQIKHFYVKNVLFACSDNFFFFTKLQLSGAPGVMFEELFQK